MDCEWYGWDTIEPRCETIATHYLSNSYLHCNDGCCFDGECLCRTHMIQRLRLHMKDRVICPHHSKGCYQYKVEVMRK